MLAVLVLGVLAAVLLGAFLSLVLAVLLSVYLSVGGALLTLCVLPPYSGLDGDDCFALAGVRGAVSIAVVQALYKHGARKATSQYGLV